MPVAAWQSQLLDRVMTGERLYIDPGRRRRAMFVKTPDQVRLQMDFGGPAYTYGLSEAVIKDSDVFPPTPNCRCTTTFDGVPVQQALDRIKRKVERSVLDAMKHGVQIKGA